MQTLKCRTQTSDVGLMQVHAVHRASGRRRRSALPGGSPVPSPAAPIPAIPGTWAHPSKVGGTWSADAVRARHDAQTVLNSIDWSKRDIVIWVPGTDNRTIHSSFDQAVRASWADGGVSLAKLDYEASWNMRRSVATGIATLKLVLAGIAAHGGNHRVMLAGESQGAWIIGEAAADPMLRSVIHRAVLLGHPFVARTHYEDGRDPDIVEINRQGDQVATPIRGDIDNAFAAMLAIHQKQFWKLPAVVKALAQNPLHGWLLLASALRALPGATFLSPNPHDYSTQMTAAVEYLRNGRFNDGRDARLRAGDTAVAAAA
jgi:hypothetical protein